MLSELSEDTDLLLSHNETRGTIDGNVIQTTLIGTYCPLGLSSR